MHSISHFIWVSEFLSIQFALLCIDLVLFLPFLSVDPHYLVIVQDWVFERQPLITSWSTNQWDGDLCKYNGTELSHLPYSWRTDVVSLWLLDWTFKLCWVCTGSPCDSLTFRWDTAHQVHCKLGQCVQRDFPKKKECKSEWDTRL